ncbi:hypothetical protein BDW02DRAFT_649673 [Decorospora gaudefroyi]|uniref:Cora-domain-containing protein n=1 Tax=Decorospora gaudefroyi TaxID=184978 RepID=A0A6A5KEA4_9PLEO|nr:hypothetical protein BDW02DRAFT_649673 [Decorospora gaudefroyi]
MGVALGGQVAVLAFSALRHKVGVARTSRAACCQLTMASFRSLTANRGPLEEFRARIPRTVKTKEDTAHRNIDFHLFEWSGSHSQGRERSGLRSVEELEAESEGTVRVIFAPQDVPTSNSGEGLVQLFETCGIPSAFVDESLQGVSQSFAAQEDVDGTTFIWFHFLCKVIAVVDNRIVHIDHSEDVSSSEAKERQMAQRQSHANFSWMKPGFVLKIRKQEGVPATPTRTSTSRSDDTLTPNPTRAKIELFCFGAPSTLQTRFRALRNSAMCSELLQDPHLLLEIVFEEMYKVMDSTSWAIADIFGPSETQTLEMASRPGKATKELLKDHFTGLHNLAKHTIYLRENCEAALATLDDLYNHHKAAMEDNPNASQKLTRQALKYRKTLFESTQRRLASLNARVSNIIQLSFHIVTQGDSRLMQSENQSMKTIAVMTLVFMPLGTVASIFGSQFIRLEEELPYHITVSQDFWLMWVLGIWRVWYMDAKGRLIDELESPPGGGRGYMGWRTLPQTLRRGHDKRKERKAAASHKVPSDV